MKNILIIFSTILIAFIIGRLTTSANKNDDSTIIEIISNQVGTNVLEATDVQATRQGSYWIYSYLDTNTKQHFFTITLQGQIIAKLIFPSWEEVKNFQIASSSSSPRRLVVCTEWGGGNNCWNVDFWFELKEAKVILQRVDKEFFSPDQPGTDSTVETTSDEPRQLVRPEGMYLKDYY